MSDTQNDLTPDFTPELPSMPTDRASLRTAIERLAGVAPASGALIDGHTPPMDYLGHAFFHGTPRDCVVWANRGGGKTFAAALATALDLIYKPTVEIKLVAGSREQASRMFAHLAALFEREPLAPLVQGKISASKLTLTNGSHAEILSQSHASIRGARPQIIRCDEVELFDRDVWEAIQLAPRSKQCGATFVTGAIEALSTWHLPAGLMADLVASAKSDDGIRTRTLFRWGVIDVLEECPSERPCDPCELLEECESRAKRATGHVLIDDAITMKRRASRESWQAEMLCLRPSRRDAVFPEFDPQRHVKEPAHDPALDEGSSIIAGMDFGFRSPTVVLWAHLSTLGVVHVLHEHTRDQLTLEKHIAIMRDGAFPTPAWIGVDPAGNQRNDHTGLSSVSALRNAGFTVRARRSTIENGLRALRQRLDPASGPPTLFVHPRCTTLIRAMSDYRFPSDDPHAINPVKDGADHACDALRYMVTNMTRAPRVKFSRYA